MTIGSLLWVCATLGIVLGLLALVVRLLRRFAMGTPGGRGRLPMEVVQRLSLGPKQGIAVVRVGDRLLAVSLGEGGVRPLTELGDAERALLAERPATQRTAMATGLANGLAAMVGGAGATQSPAAMAAAVRPQAPMARAALLSPLPPMTAVPDPALPGVPAMPAMPAVPETPSGFGNLLRAAMRGGAAATVAVLLAFAPLESAHAQAPAAIPQPAAAPAVGGQPAAIPRPTGAATPTGVGQARPLTPAPLPGVVPVASPRGAAQPAIPAAAATNAATATAPVAAMPDAGRADSMITRLAPSMDLRLGDEQGGLRLSGTVGVIVMMGLLTLLPTLVLMMTGFTRILIVLHFLRQALGTQSAPPSHLVAGLALLLTGFVMAPTLREVNSTALEPWMSGEIAQTEMMSRGVVPFRDFMARQTRDGDIRAFLDMSDAPEPATINDVPLVVLTSAFVTSELRTAFQIGFALFLPFIVIDVVVASVLMSMGMFMLPPAMISLPFKLLLFVLVDGWALLTQSLVASFK